MAPEEAPHGGAAQPWEQLGGVSGSGSKERGVCTWSVIPTVQAQEHRALGTKPWVWPPPGTGGDQEGTGQQGNSSQAEQISGTAPEASSLLKTESSIVIVGAECRAPELAAATVVVPPGTSQDKQPPLSLTVTSLDT